MIATTADSRISSSLASSRARSAVAPGTLIGRRIDRSSFPTFLQRQSHRAAGGVPTSLVRTIAVALDRRGRPVLVDQDTLRGTVEVVVLARAHRPEKRRQTSAAEQQRDGDQIGDCDHAAAERKRSALATTISDEADIASAAISGVT